jgi:hypothetical protein
VYVKTLRDDDLAGANTVKCRGFGPLKLTFVRSVASEYHFDAGVCQFGSAESGSLSFLDRFRYALEHKFNYWRKVVGENAGCGALLLDLLAAPANSLALHAVWKGA